MDLQATLIGYFGDYAGNRTGSACSGLVLTHVPHLGPLSMYVFAELFFLVAQTLPNPLLTEHHPSPL